GPRLCLSPTAEPGLLAFLAAALRDEARTQGASGLHVLFPEEAQSEALAALGLERRTGCQYQWFNEGFRDFPHFLETFSSRKRKNLRKERQRIAEAGIRFQILEGGAI